MPTFGTGLHDHAILCALIMEQLHHRQMGTRKIHSPLLVKPDLCTTAFRLSVAANDNICSFIYRGLMQLCSVAVWKLWAIVPYGEKVAD